MKKLITIFLNFLSWVSLKHRQTSEVTTHQTYLREKEIAEMRERIRLRYMHHGGMWL